MPCAHPADEVLDRGLPVGGAQQRVAGGGQRVQRLEADLRRAGAEATVGGPEVVGDDDRVGHDGSSSDVSDGECGLTSLSEQSARPAAMSPILAPATRAAGTGNGWWACRAEDRPRRARPPRRAGADRGGPGGVRPALRRAGTSRRWTRGLRRADRRRSSSATSATYRWRWAAGGGAPTWCDSRRRPAAEIKRMYVAPAGRRTGLARAMLAHLETTALAAGADVMVLETGTEQPEAIALYESSGYARGGELRPLRLVAEEPLLRQAARARLGYHRPGGWLLAGTGRIVRSGLAESAADGLVSDTRAPSRGASMRAHGQERYVVIGEGELSPEPEQSDGGDRRAWGHPTSQRRRRGRLPGSRPRLARLVRRCRSGSPGWGRAAAR